MPISAACALSSFYSLTYSHVYAQEQAQQKDLSLVEEIAEELRSEALANAGPEAPMVFARSLASVDPDEWGLLPEEEQALAVLTAQAWLAVDDVDARGEIFRSINRPRGVGR